MLTGNVLLTGGTGTLGKALLKRASDEQWPCMFTIYSRSPEKQQALKRLYPQHRYVLGDVRDSDRLSLLAVGHSLIIHAAAQKHIPEAEQQPAQCYENNVEGSYNVLLAARYGGVLHVLGISTDKACHPVNAYGCSKLMMERMYQQFALANPQVKVNLCRYGNVLGSTGSVLEVWKGALERGEKPRITDASMTRFWLSSSQAVDLLLYSLTEPSSTITIPRLPGLSMARLLEYTCGNVEYDTMGLRPGEKMHEELLTRNESLFCDFAQNYLRLWPVTSKPLINKSWGAYTSDMVDELTRDELDTLLTQ